MQLEGDDEEKLECTVCVRSVRTMIASTLFTHLNWIFQLGESSK